MTWISVNIDIDDIYDELSKSDKEDLAEALYEDGILEDHPNKNISRLVLSDKTSFDEEQFQRNIGKLFYCYHRLDEEFIDFINKKANDI